MFARLTRFTQSFAYHRFSGAWLFFYSVIESVFFPVSPEFLFVPMTLARPKRAFAHATIAAIGSTAGGIIGYGIGYWAFDSLAYPVMAWSCQNLGGACPETIVPTLRHLFDEHGYGIIALSAMSPIIPYRFVILAAGMGKMAFIPFVILSLVVHWLRYALICWLVARYGAKAWQFLQRHMFTILMGIGLAGLVVLLWIIYF